MRIILTQRGSSPMDPDTAEELLDEFDVNGDGHFDINGELHAKMGVCMCVRTWFVLFHLFVITAHILIWSCELVSSRFYFRY